MRIDSSFSSHFSSSIDVNPISQGQGKSAGRNACSAAAGEVDSTVIDFKRALGKEDFDRVIDGIKKIPVELKYTRLEFKIHDDTNRIIVRIYDKASDELITEIPPEKFLDLIAGLWKQAGLIVDEKV